MSDAYNAEALWLKAKLFLNHAMDDEPRTFDEQALWASLALELLAKAALAQVSPVLIATPNEEGTNLLIASGLVAGDGKFSSVTASTLMSRCSKAFRPFNEAEAKKITKARNDYLHGGAAVFTRIPPDAWWPSYWAQAIILVTAQDKTIEQLVGQSRVAVVEDHLARNKRNIEHRAEMLVARAAQRLAQYRTGDLPARVVKEFDHPKSLRAGMAYFSGAICPVCGEIGDLEGDNIVDSQAVYSDDILDDSYFRLCIAAERFSCPTCRLVLDRSDLIAQVGLKAEFTELELMDTDPDDVPD